MVGSENHFLGFDGFVLMVSKGSGFVAIPDVVNGEERLAFLALFPSACVIPPGIVPEFLGVSSIGSAQVVVRLRAIAGEVAPFLQELVIETDRGGNLKTTAHRLRSVGD